MWGIKPAMVNEGEPQALVGCISIKQVKKPFILYGKDVKDLYESLNKRYPYSTSYIIRDTKDNQLFDGIKLNPGFDVKIDFDWMRSITELKKMNLGGYGDLFTFVTYKKEVHIVNITSSTTAMDILNAFKVKNVDWVNYYRENNGNENRRNVNVRELLEPIVKGSICGTNNVIIERGKENLESLVPPRKSEYECENFVIEYNDTYDKHNLG